MAFECGDRVVKYQFPKLGQWDLFIRDAADLFNRLSISAANLQLPENIISAANNLESFPIFAKLAAIAITPKQISNLILKIFFKYLNPQIDGVFFKKKWALKNMPVDLLVRLFISIIAVEEWVKKNGIFVMTKMFQIPDKPESIQ